jgi:hypothetical protein
MLTKIVRLGEYHLLCGFSGSSYLITINIKEPSKINKDSQEIGGLYDMIELQPFTFAISSSNVTVIKVDESTLDITIIKQIGLFPSKPISLHKINNDLLLVGQDNNLKIIDLSKCESIKVIKIEGYDAYSMKGINNNLVIVTTKK